MFRSRDRIYALLALAFIVIMVIWSAIIHHNHPDDWLFANAGPGMIKVCAIIVAVWWTGFGLWAFIGWWRETYGVSPAEPVHRDARVVVPMRAKRDDNPPTQPIPVPPDMEPVVNAVNE
jgi:amino acid transporter